GPRETLQFVSLASGAEREVRVSPRFLVQYVVYAPDGERLYLTGIRPDDPPYGLFASDLDGHARPLASTDNNWMSSPYVSSDGKRIALSEFEFEGSLWVVEPQ